MIPFVYQDTKNHLNFVKCTDVACSGIRRFSVSVIAEKMIEKKLGVVKDAKSKPTKYIISTAVNHSPEEWTGSDFFENNDKETCFYHLSKKYLADLRKGNAMILFDQSFEGYQVSWLWNYFHEECKKYTINPQAVIYVTGNTEAENQYNDWAKKNNITEKINVIPYVVFESDVYRISEKINSEDFYNKSIEYKKNNLEKIKSFNCLQKRLRPHRIWLYNYLYRADLLDQGLISMNSYDYEISYFEGKWLPKELDLESQKKLPLLVYGKNNNEKPDHYYINRILKEVYLDTWITVVSEASFGDADQTIFLSEKLFKPISCFHPFIIAGNRGSLQKLKEMGYETFENYIDESYDVLPTFNRLDAVIKSLENFCKVEDKLSWFESMKGVLEHNYNTFVKNSKEINPSVIKIKECYQKYFRMN
jgi:hypothetical protein